MRKEYIKPAAREYQLHPAAIIADSGTTKQVSVGGPGTSKVHGQGDWDEDVW